MAADKGQGGSHLKVLSTHTCTFTHVYACTGMHTRSILLAGDQSEDRHETSTELFITLQSGEGWLAEVKVP